MTRVPEEAEAALRIPDVLPILPVRDAVVFPFVIVPLSVSEEANLQALDHALARDRLLFLVAQKDPRCDDPRQEDLHGVGTVATILRLLKLPDGRVRILVQGLVRARLLSTTYGEPFLQARLEPLEEESPEAPDLEVGARMRSVQERLEQAANLGKSISPDVLMMAAGIEDVSRLADLAASNLDLDVEDAQPLLEELAPVRRLERVSELLSREIQVLKVQNDISAEARNEMDRSQREYFLRQQMKAIQDELGEVDETLEEIETFRSQAAEKNPPEAVMEELERQIRRLRRSHPDSAETTTIRTYLEWLTALPWNTYSEDVLDLPAARKILDEDHYGLEKVKQRILEYLAVRKLKSDAKGPLLCFVGPPGVGK
ncbi:MAG: LON peptidase substrate-binding domain-containing protein, partial [Acidobacteria bacterium]|nr:LON peptidase substrate-binding domain-containing protein [Acidobacteriota bacterium]